MNYKIDKSFPSLDALNMNVEYGHMMLSHLGGIHSKMNEVSLYFYNSIILEKVYPDLANAMHEISIVEMQHLEMIAKICLRLGVDPRLWECQNDLLEYWSPSFNVYPLHIESMLENVIMQEKKMIDIYSSYINCIHEPIIQEVLGHFILDEQLHVKIFEYFLEKIKETQ